LCFFDNFQVDFVGQEAEEGVLVGDLIEQRAPLDRTRLVPKRHLETKIVLQLVTKDELVTKVYEEWSVFYVYESKSI
jgi:hypothetical protein